MSAQTVDRVRCGGRNYLRVGDPCYVRAGGGDRSGFRARVLELRRTSDEQIEVCVVVARLSDRGRSQRKAGALRVVPLWRVERRLRRPEEQTR